MSVLAVVEQHFLHVVNLFLNFILLMILTFQLILCLWIGLISTPQKLKRVFINLHPHRSVSLETLRLADRG